MVKARTSKADPPGDDPVGAVTPPLVRSGRASDRNATPSAGLQRTPALLEAVMDPANLNTAWRRVKVNRGAAGVDGVSVDAFPDWMRVHWPALREAVLDGSYRPQPVLRVEIPKASGGKRLLGIPTVADRVIQQAMLQVLGPMWDPEFSESSFGFRPGRSAHGAVRQVKRYIVEEKRKCAVDIDLRRFFDTVDHRIVMGRLARKLSGDPLLRLIGRYLRAGVEVDGMVEPTRCGVPQGGPLSPLLANIVLDDLDKMLEKRGHRFARYADDFVILVGSWRSARRVLSMVTAFVERRLKLTVNREKSPSSRMGRGRVADLPRVQVLRWEDWCERDVEGGIPLPAEAAHQSPLADSDVGPTCQAAPNRRGLDGLLWLVRTPERVGGYRPLAASADENVLLGAVENPAEPHPQTDGNGPKSLLGSTHRRSGFRAMGLFATSGSGHAKRVARTAGFALRVS